MPHFTRDTLPPAERFAEYRNRTLTRAAWIGEPFTVQTPAGVITITPCGWLTLDSNDDPYPISPDVFDAAYEPACG